MKSFNTQCQSASHEPPGCTSDVVGARPGPGSRRFRANGYGRAQDAESKSDVRSPETWLPEAARRQRPVMCRDVGGPRCDEYGSRRRIPGGAPNPFPAGRRRLPGSAGEPRPAPSPQARCLGGACVAAPPGRCIRTALPRRAEGTGQKRTEHGPLEGALAARGETGAGVSRETHVLHHESAEERPETE